MLDSVCNGNFLWHYLAHEVGVLNYVYFAEMCLKISSFDKFVDGDGSLKIIFNRVIAGYCISVSGYIPNMATEESIVIS